MDDSQKNLEFSVVFQKCMKGESLNVETIICEKCPIGTYSDQYNLDDLNQYCNYCFDFYPFFCYGSNIRSPKPGFWRYNETSKKFLKYPNQNACLGDIYFNQLKTSSSWKDTFKGSLSQIFSFTSDLDKISFKALIQIHFIHVCSL